MILFAMKSMCYDGLIYKLEFNVLFVYQLLERLLRTSYVGGCDEILDEIVFILFILKFIIRILNCNNKLYCIISYFMKHKDDI